MTNTGSQDDANVTPFRDVNADSNQRRIADDLRQARLERGLELRDVSGTLRIRAVYLEALEDGRFDDLPGTTYVAGFLRTYGDFLGLDAEELVRRFKDETGGVLVHQQLSFPVPASEARQPTAGIIIGALILAIAGAAIWFVNNERDLVDLELVPAVEETHDTASDDSNATVDAAPAVEETMTTEEDDEGASDDPSAVETAVEEVEAVAEEVVDELVAETEMIAEAALEDAVSDDDSSAEEQDVDFAAVEPDTPDETAAEDVSPDAAVDVAVPDAEEIASDEALAETEALLDTDSGYVPRIYGRPNTDSRVEIVALDESWIQVEAPNNVILLTRLLLPGDIYHVPNRDDVTLDTGNAGGLEVRVDGETIAPLGDAGMVVRNVSLSADALLSR
tara:strand:- start:411 stop:1586 length:1176 start_codon:yes stop_codon:yes gene_type:complete